MINRVRVLKRKQRKQKERSGQKWKKMQVEVESELESDGSGEESWRAWGLHDIAFGILGLQSNLAERNQLLREKNDLQREQNSYLHRIARCLESGLGPEELEVPVEDSTMRE